MTDLELDAAKRFVESCRELYPEQDLMDEQTLREYTKCCLLIKKKVIQQNKEEYYAELEAQEVESQPIRSKTLKKPKKKGKLAQFEEDVIECLRQGFGEEKQLLEEAYNRKNVFARANYIKAYNRALDRFRDLR